MTTLIEKKKAIARLPNQRPLNRRSFRDISRRYLAKEKDLEFVIEALLFAIIVAISAWPILAVVDALNRSI